jgi:DNA-binding protein HU-beta
MANRPAPAKKAPAKKVAAKSSAPVAAKKAAATPAPKAKVTAPVVTLKAVFEQLAETHALPKKQAHGMLADFVAAMTTI